MTTDAVTDVRTAAYSKALKLPVVARQFKAVAQDAQAEGRTYLDFLAALLEQEVMQREQNGVHLRIQQARFPYVKTLDAYDFTAVPTLNKAKVLALTHCEWVGQHENVLLVGNAGTGKTHLGIALGIAACRAGKRVRFYTAASLVNELIAAPAGGKPPPAPAHLAPLGPCRPGRARIHPLFGYRQPTAVQLLQRAL